MLTAVAALGGGMAAGIVTGLLPALHPNSVIFLLLPLYFGADIAPVVFVAFATGVSTVHTFVSFVPAVFVGAPEGETALSTLPGHGLLHEGRGVEAVERTVHGGLVAALLAVAALPALLYLVPLVYGTVASHMHLVLLLLLAGLVVTERRPGAAAGVVVLAGLLGVGALSSSLANTQYILFPLFAGLFGLPIILESLRQGGGVPAQGRSLPVPAGSTVRGGIAGFAAGVVAGFLPGAGSSQSVLLVDGIAGMERDGFLVALGGVTTADLFVSLVALHAIGNPRSGAAVAMQQVLPRVDLGTTLQVAGMCMVGVGTGALVTRRLARRAAAGLAAVDYDRLLAAVAVFIAAGSIALAGSFGLLVLATATATGALAGELGVRRSDCMAALIVPTILHYAGVTLPLL
ncbi:MAG: tripartite tricarboxylate transporter permease [Candidatus Nanohaloarchaea archaeon]|nr:tripartite tricarboxylate transporter permease [Candidatus Nanohaloarchaea archaeon]